MSPLTKEICCKCKFLQISFRNVRAAVAYVLHRRTFDFESSSKSVASNVFEACYSYKCQSFYFYLPVDVIAAVFLTVKSSPHLSPLYTLRNV